jgi:hypothetical protein
MAYREKRIYSGDYFEAEIYQVPESETRKPRKIKEHVSSPTQKNLNNKNSIKYLIRVINTNFTDNDIHLTLTYDPKNYPLSEEEAKKDMRNFIRRVQRYCKKHNLSSPKYIYIFEYKDPTKYKKGIRMHHHVIISGHIGRDELEKIWKKGRANAKRLQADEFGYEGLARYVSKNPKGSKKYIPSRNLEKPTIKVNDHKYSKRKVEKLARTPEDRKVFEELYKGYTFTQCEVAYNDLTGTSLYIKMRTYKKEGLD